MRRSRLFLRRLSGPGADRFHFLYCAARQIIWHGLIRLRRAHVCKILVWAGCKAAQMELKPAVIDDKRGDSGIIPEHCVIPPVRAPFIAHLACEIAQVFPCLAHHIPKKNLSVHCSPVFAAAIVAAVAIVLAIPFSHARGFIVLHALILWQVFKNDGVCLRAIKA